VDDSFCHLIKYCALYDNKDSLFSTKLNHDKIRITNGAKNGKTNSQLKAKNHRLSMYCLFMEGNVYDSLDITVDFVICD